MTAELRKHTPAPWGYDSEDCVVRTEEQDICQMFGDYEGNEYLNQIAPNGRLIAAAPDLLEALQELCGEQNGWPLETRKDGWLGAMSKAQAAIAKALPGREVRK